MRRKGGKARGRDKSVIGDANGDREGRVDFNAIFIGYNVVGIVLYPKFFIREKNILAFIVGVVWAHRSGRT